MATIPGLEKILEKCWAEEAAPCQAACPLHLDARGYILAIREGRFQDGLDLIRERLPFPGILGRICDYPCEARCRRQEKEASVAIRDLKRFLADRGRGKEWLPDLPEIAQPERVAIIGAGPAGLMAAYELRKLGYRPTIFESSSYLGGMMKMGIPRFRLPQDILEEEVSLIPKLGIEVRLNTAIGKDVKLGDLKSDFDAVFLATGAHLSRRINIEGSELEGVVWGIDFLREANLGRAGQLKGKVAVIGGGNVAIDVALTALRSGAREVRIACLESRAEMPAFPREIEQAVKEGVIIDCSWGPSKIFGDGKSVTGIELVRCTSVFDEERRFNPTFRASETLELEADTVIIAIGQASDLSYISPGDGIALKGGLICHDPVTLQTSSPQVFAGGDAAFGARSVVDALASGRSAAISIDRYLKGKDLAAGREREAPWESRLAVSIAGVAVADRVSQPVLPVSESQNNFKEVELAYTEAQAIQEAGRCLQCECKLCVKDCVFLKKYCASPLELARQFEQGFFREKPVIPYSCALCGYCEKICPEGLDIGDLCKELRYQLVAEGKGPLPQHEFVNWNLNLSTSDKFALAEPDPATGQCQRVFFPGCGLSGYSPSLVIRSYEYLRQKLPDTGIILNCCGAPVRDLGQPDKLQAMLKTITDNLARLGATEIITGCTNCFMTFKQFAPQLKRRTIYEVILEHGLPEGLKPKEWTFSLHDSCPARDEPQIHESVRALVRKMGYNIEEMAHSGEFSQCCGMGGMAGYADIWLAFQATKRRVDEAHHDLLTYCANCREVLTNPEVGSKPALHILDLVFNPDWEQDRLNPPLIGSTRRDNQTQLKKKLVEIISKTKQGSASESA